MGAARPADGGSRRGGVAAAIRRRGLMFVLSSPSGAGKTTISRKLLADDENLQLSISATTRPKRPGERDGVDYHFVDPPTFDGMVRRGELLEHAVVFGNRYGTPRAPVEKALAAGRDVLFDIDWQGTQQVFSKMPEDVVRVFVLPPSVGELERRLRTRNQDSDEVVAQRMAKAADEMSHYDAYDYIVVNEQVERAVAQVKSILTAERQRLRRLIGLDDFVKQLQGEGR